MRKTRAEMEADMKIMVKEKKIRITVVDTRGLYSYIYDELWCNRDMVMTLVTEYEKRGLICIVEN